MKILKLAYVVPCLLIANCATYKSYQTNSFDNKPGIAYFLPQKAIIIKVGKLDKGIRKITITTSDAYADLDAQYILNPKELLFGKSIVHFGVNPKGLLSKSEGESQSSGTLFGSALGALSSGGNKQNFSNSNDEQKCQAEDEFDFTIMPNSNKFAETTNICGIIIKINLVGSNAFNQSFLDRSDVTLNSFDKIDLQSDIEAKNADDKNSKKNNLNNTSLNMDNGNKKSNGPLRETGSYGIFYRIELPYAVTALQKIISQTSNEEGIFSQTSLVFSPVGSKTYLAPAQFSSFSGNSFTKMTFLDGVLATYDTDWNSHLIGFLQFPAEVLSGYSSALLSGLTSVNEKNSQEKIYYETLQQLEIAKIKLLRCQIAISSQVEDKINSECKQ